MSVSPSTSASVAPTAPSRAAKAAASAGEGFGAMVADVATEDGKAPIALTGTAADSPPDAVADTSGAASVTDDLVPEPLQPDATNAALLTGAALFMAQPQPVPVPVEATLDPAAGSTGSISTNAAAASAALQEAAASDRAALADTPQPSEPTAPAATDLAQPAGASATAAATAEILAAALGQGASTGEPSDTAMIAKAASEAVASGKTPSASGAPTTTSADTLLVATPRMAAQAFGANDSNAAASDARVEARSAAPAGAAGTPTADIAPTARAMADAAPAPAAPSPTAATSAFAAQIQAQIQAQTQADAPAAAAAADAVPTGQNAPATQATPITTTPVVASFSGLSRATLETTVQLAAQITRQLAGRSTRFEMGLTPEGLGKVNVSMDIDADGQLTAQLAFDNPLAAADLRARADELRSQLQDAGFKLADDALTFSQQDASSSDGGAEQRSDQNQGRAFASASRLSVDADTLPVPAAWVSLSLTPRGVDLKV